jgi:hypothetical protein
VISANNLCCTWRNNFKTIIPHYFEKHARAGQQSFTNVKNKKGKPPPMGGEAIGLCTRIVPGQEYGHFKTIIPEMRSPTLTKLFGSYSQI